MKDIIIDAFAGGGGVSVGAVMALGRQVDIAINHNIEAIRMHEVNHPNTIHLMEDIFEVDLSKYVGDNHVALMWASPDCRHFSKAKGSAPKSQSVRMLPWAVHKHAMAIKPDVIIMENVEEIRDWGPLDKKNRPIRKKKGKEYQKFLKKMYLAGYEKIETRVLVAADYGAPTTRKRWYAVFRRDGRPIVWPKQTHSKDVKNSQNKNEKNDLLPWEPIWKYLDLKDLGRSIFGRKSPLAKKTMNRIARGVEKFVLKNPEPFIVQINQNGTNIRDPKIQESVSLRAEISSRDRLVLPFITKFYKSGTGQSLSEPIHTITTSAGHFGIVSVMAVPVNELMENLDKSIKEQNKVNDIIQKCTWASQFIMEYYGNGTGQSLYEPLHTIVTRERFALITVLGNEYVIMDIFLRMLKPEELKLGQGFPADYIIDRDINYKYYPVKEQVARIGNSVVPIMAQLLIGGNCPYLKVGERAPSLRIDYSEPQLKFA